MIPQLEQELIQRVRQLPEDDQLKVLAWVRQLTDKLAVTTDAMGYPIHYFEAIDAIIADDIEERGEQGDFEIREAFE